MSKRKTFLRSELNGLYYLPMNYVGWFARKKHMDDKTGEVVKERLSLRGSLIIYAPTVGAIFGYGRILFLEPDVAFVQDGDRSTAIRDDREKYSEQIKELLRSHGKRFITVRGSYRQRFETAVREVRRLLASRED